VKSSDLSTVPARTFRARRAAWAAAAILVVTLTGALAPDSASATPATGPSPAAPTTAGPAAAQPTATPSASATPIDVGPAQDAKRAADHKVAELQQEITAKTKLVQQLTTAASQAESRYAGQLVMQAQAEDAADQASAEATAADAAYTAADNALRQLVVLAYENGGVVGSSAGLLLAPDPNAVLEQATTQQIVTDHQASVAQAMQRAKSARTEAEKRQQDAVEQVAVQTDRLNALRQQAESNLATARAEITAVQADLVAAKATQTRATAVLTSFLGGWALSEPASADALDAHYQAIAKAVAPARPAPNSTHWTAAMGRTAVYRALQWIGTPYAWAGGDASGPTAGLCAGGAAENDCHVSGFDCSGLALFAWAPYLHLDHLAATQYTSAGTLHPAADKLLPGDLVFWSSNGRSSGIHHVAIYVGAGNVIQAPQSGDIVRITPLASVDSGYFGATRPRT
jgi:cell wall-associated NlpC family hydrolase